MAITGYIADKEKIPRGVLTLTLEIMEDLHCDNIYEEETSVTTERPRLKYIMEEAKIGDTLVLHKLSNALANVVELANLCRLCHNKNIRLVSILDHIDTSSEKFKTTPQDILLFFSTFSEEAYDSKHRSRRLEDIPDSIKDIEKCQQKDERDATIINMYMAEYSYNDIMQHLGIKSTRTIAKVLNKYGIKLSRKKYDRADLKSSNTSSNRENDGSRKNKINKVSNH